MLLLGLAAGRPDPGEAGVRRDLANSLVAHMLLMLQRKVREGALLSLRLANVAAASKVCAESGEELQCLHLLHEGVVVDAGDDAALPRFEVPGPVGRTSAGGRRDGSGGDASLGRRRGGVMHGGGRSGGRIRCLGASPHDRSRRG